MKLRNFALTALTVCTLFVNSTSMAQSEIFFDGLQALSAYQQANKSYTDSMIQFLSDEPSIERRLELAQTQQRQSSEELAEKKQLLEKLTFQILQKNSELESLKAKSIGKEERIKDLTTIGGAQLAKLKKIQDEQLLLKADIEATYWEVRTYNNNITKINLSLAKNKRDLEVIQLAQQGLLKSLNSFQTQLSNTRKQIAQNNANGRGSTSATKSLKSQENLLETKTQLIESQIIELEHRIEFIKLQAIGLNHEKNSLEEIKNYQDSFANDMQARSNQLNQQIMSLTSETRGIQEELSLLENLESAIAKMTPHIAELNSQISKVTSEITQLEIQSATKDEAFAKLFTDWQTLVSTLPLKEQIMDELLLNLQSTLGE